MARGRTQRVGMTQGRLAGTVQTVPAAVAARLIEEGQAEELHGEVSEDILDGDPVAHHRDPKGKRK
jgi:hypothetical protein